MKLKTNILRGIISEVVAERRIVEEKVRKNIVLENRSNRIKKIIAEKSGWMDKLSNAFSSVNPSQDVDDPGKVKSVLDRSLSHAGKIAQSFEASALNSTKAINQFHTAVRDSLDKVTSLSDTLGPDQAAMYQKQIVDVVRQFYSLLKKESERIDSFQQIIKQDLAEKGISKNQAYQNTSGLKKAAEPAKNPASSTFKLGQAPRGNATSTIRTDVSGPSRPSNTSFKAV